MSIVQLVKMYIIYHQPNGERANYSLLFLSLVRRIHLNITRQLKHQLNLYSKNYNAARVRNCPVFIFFCLLRSTICKNRRSNFQFQENKYMSIIAKLCSRTLRLWKCFLVIGLKSVLRAWLTFGRVWKWGVENGRNTAL